MSMKLIDLSQFTQNFTRDNAEEIAAEVSSMKTIIRKMDVGVHDVTFTAVAMKDGEAFKLNDKAGGTLIFSMIGHNLAGEEQLFVFFLPTAITYAQGMASTDPKIKFPFQRTSKDFQCMGINIPDFREAVLKTNGEAITKLIGTRFMVENKWDAKKLHLEYDNMTRCYHFTKPNGERFTSGEMAAPVHPEKDKWGDARFAEALVIAHSQNHQVALRMESIIKPHPTANNDKVNDALAALLRPQPKKVPNFVNATENPFKPKKVSAPLEFEKDIDIEG